MNIERELYQQIIVDHGKKPRNFHPLTCECVQRVGYNPLCGDKLVLYIKLSPENTIEKASFTGEGCAISMASASILTEVIQGMHIDEVQRLFNSLHAAVTQGVEFPVVDTKYSKVATLIGVQHYPARVKCATLVWHTCMALLKDSFENEYISTE